MLQGKDNLKALYQADTFDTSRQRYTLSGFNLLQYCTHTGTSDPSHTDDPNGHQIIDVVRILQRHALYLVFVRQWQGTAMGFHGAAVDLAPGKAPSWACRGTAIALHNDLP